MEPMTLFFLIIIVVVFGTPLYYGYNAYDKKYLEPKRRYKALSDVAHKVADHNAKHIIAMKYASADNQNSLPGGSSTQNKKDSHQGNKKAVIKRSFDITKALQETFGSTRELPEYLSLSDVLKEDHPANIEIKSWFEEHKQEAYHSGPFDEDLSNDEWAYVQDQYRKALQDKLRVKVNARFRSQEVEHFESEVYKEVEKYVQAREEVNKDPLAEDFKKLSDHGHENDEKHVDDDNK